MLDNYMYGDSSGNEGREHYHQCKTNCEWADQPLGEDREVCPMGHEDHECNCEQLADDEYAEITSKLMAIYPILGDSW